MAVSVDVSTQYTNVTDRYSTGGALDLGGGDRGGGGTCPGHMTYLRDRRTYRQTDRRTATPMRSRAAAQLSATKTYSGSTLTK